MENTSCMSMYVSMPVHNRLKSLNWILKNKIFLPVFVEKNYFCKLFSKLWFGSSVNFSM